MSKLRNSLPLYYVNVPLSNRYLQRECLLLWGVLRLLKFRLFILCEDAMY